MCVCPLRFPDSYLGLTTMGENMSLSNLKRALSHVVPGGRCISGRPPVTAELMVHPGYPSRPHEGGCGDGPDQFSKSADRQHELNVLTDPRLQVLYRQEEVHCCSFRDL